jgi:hypothetical protein
MPAVRPFPAPDSQYADPPAVAASDPAAGATTEPRCPNCDTPAPGRYCPACGQAQHERHRSVRSIVDDALDSFLGWDGKIPVTLWLLVRRPGMLTAEYVAGRRMRYLPPLRLYLTLSAVLVLAFQFARPRMRDLQVTMAGDARPRAGARVGRDSAGRPPARGAPVRADAAAAAARDSATLDSLAALGPWRKLKRGMFGDRIRSLEHMSKAERERVVRDAFIGKLGTMFFLLLPAFAGIVGVLYRRTPLVYAEHLVFALHVHAAAALGLAVALILGGAAGGLVLLAGPPYLFLALRRVYGGSRRRTLAKLVVLGGIHAGVLAGAVLLTALAAFLVG